MASSSSGRRYRTSLILAAALLLTIVFLFVLEERRLERSSYATRATQLAQVASDVSVSLYGIVVGEREPLKPVIVQKRYKVQNERIESLVRDTEDTGVEEQRPEPRGQRSGDDETDTESSEAGVADAAGKDAEARHEVSNGVYEEDDKDDQGVDEQLDEQPDEDDDDGDDDDDDDDEEDEDEDEDEEEDDGKDGEDEDDQEDEDEEDDKEELEGDATNLEEVQFCTPLGTGIVAGEVTPATHRRVLSPELIREVAVSNRVIVTWANLHYLDFVLNWYYHLTRTCATNVLVGAMDDELYDELAARDIATFSMTSNLTTNDFGWGSPTFHKMGREKISLIGAVTSMGFDLILTDVDTVFSRNPNPFVDKYPEADVLTSSDHLRPTSLDGGLEYYVGFGNSELGYARSAANIGIMYFSSRAKDLGEEWGRMLDKNEKLWDQNAFNQLMRKELMENNWLEGGVQGNEREDRLFTSYGNSLKFGILPVALFCSGHTYFVQDLPDRIYHTVPYVVHATFQYGGTEGKRNRFRERLLWNDPPEYFQVEPGSAGFLALAPLSIPPELVSGPDADSLLGHFRLVNYQFRHLRAALALGRLLNRVVIMPEFWVMYDRFFYPINKGRNGGAYGPPRGAFVCPLDHVLDLNNLKARYSYREFSFLKNPRFRADGNSPPEATVRFVSSERAAESRPSSAEWGFPGWEQAAVSATEPMRTASAVIEALREHEGAELLVFEEVAELLDPTRQEFWDVPGEDGDEKKAFESFTDDLRVLSSQWCCEPGHKPGHILYDLMFDVIPHTDRRKREWNVTNIGEVYN